jgi:D-glycero-D-manno-heptose 1,7-bisphosphate phosphatase
VTPPLSWRRAGAPPRSRAVFVDRDGVVTRWLHGFVLSEAEIVFNDEVIRALGAIDRERYALVVASNQSCVGRGLLSAERLRTIMDRVVDGMRARGAELDAWYCCIHAPGDGCPCRKPAPGLLTAARDELGLDLAASYFIGDQPSDMEAARRAGAHGLPVRADDAAGVRARLASLSSRSR